MRGLLTQGHPGNKARDFFRYECVLNLMYPMTTHPELGLVRAEQRVNKTKAVTELADMEAQWFGRRPTLREIWRSLRRVEDVIGTLQAQLEIARTNLAVRVGKPRSG